MQPANAEKVVHACCALHNYLRTEVENSCNREEGARDAEERREELPTDMDHQDMDMDIAGIQVRERYRAYFNGVGEVPWQLQHVRETGPALNEP